MKMLLGARGRTLDCRRWTWFIYLVLQTVNGTISLRRAHTTFLTSFNGDGKEKGRQLRQDGKGKGGMWLFLRVSQHTVLRQARIDSVFRFFIVQETGQLVVAGVVRYGHR